MASQDELSMSLCDDGHTHGFLVFDDAILVTPMCGKVVGTKRVAPQDNPPMCNACVPLIAEWAGIPIDEFERQLGLPPGSL